MTNYRIPSHLAAKARAVGLAPDPLMSQIEPGAVFEAKDEAIDFPSTRIPGGTRTSHTFRRVIIVDRIEEGRAPDLKTITVIPCSTSSRGRTRVCDFDLPDPQSYGFTVENITALVSLIQPILKSDLEKRVGRLPANVWVQLQARLAVKFGLLSETEVNALAARTSAIRPAPLETPMLGLVDQIGKPPGSK